MTRVKICGITNVADARAACEAGADTVGLNFYARSPRAVSATTAVEIRKQVPAGVQVFGVFVNSDPADVMDIFSSVRLDAVQLHGDESPAVVGQLAREITVFKAVRLGPDFSVSTLENYPDAWGFLFDAADAATGQYGGTGRLVDWGVAQQIARSHRIILAGGLNVENVTAAILQVRPYGVDVASGVEVAPGSKDHYRMREFIREVRRADQQLETPARELRAT